MDLKGFGRLFVCLEAETKGNDLMKLKFFKKSDPIVTCLVLMAAFALLGVGQGQAGDKREIIEPGINASLKVMNGTPWVMPPEVEALFPKDAVFDEKVWKKIFGERVGERSSRSKVRLMKGRQFRICKDYDKNISLYGGLYYTSSIVADIHRDHPNKNKFHPIKWVEVSPMEYVFAISGYCNALFEYYYRVKVDESASDSTPSYWDSVSTKIKQLLQSGKDVRVQTANIGLVNDGKKFQVIRFGFDSILLCKTTDDVKHILWHYYVIGDDKNTVEITKEFNRISSQFNYAPFVYDGHVLYMTEFGIYSLIYSDHGGYPLLFFEENCFWGEEQSQKFVAVGGE